LEKIASDEDEEFEIRGTAASIITQIKKNK
jgi:hypothetical protein